MRRFRLRIEIRALMIAIAAAAVLLGAGVAAVRLKSLSSAYRSRAVDYAVQERLWADNTQRLTKLIDDSERIDREFKEETRRHSGLDRVLLISQGSIFGAQAIDARKRVGRSRAKAEWFAMMKARYEFASSHPWLSIPTDPQEPK